MNKRRPEMEIKMQRPSRCIHCLRAPSMTHHSDGGIVISCDGIAVAGETYDEAVSRWNMEMTKIAAGIVA